MHALRVNYIFCHRGYSENAWETFDFISVPNKSEMIKMISSSYFTSAITVRVGFEFIFVPCRIQDKDILVM